jgi:hypothetical protein
MILEAFASSYSTKLAVIYMADAVAMQPVRRPLRVVRIKNGDGPVANVQRIMQGPAYQEKERRVATWNAAGCGSG